jgi:hypothetical protein
MICEATDFVYPLLADIYYPLIAQSQYGQIKKQWILDRSVACNADPFGSAGTEEVDPKVFLQNAGKLISRSKGDIRTSSTGQSHAVNNILITNIRDTHGNLIYKETAGARAGKGTLYEIATLDPTVGPFGNVEFYRMLWRRTENQSVSE